MHLEKHFPYFQIVLDSTMTSRLPTVILSLLSLRIIISETSHQNRMKKKTVYDWKSSVMVPVLSVKV